MLKKNRITPVYNKDYSLYYAAVVPHFKSHAPVIGGKFFNSIVQLWTACLSGCRISGDPTYEAQEEKKHLSLAINSSCCALNQPVGQGMPVTTKHMHWGLLTWDLLLAGAGLHSSKQAEMGTCISIELCTPNTSRSIARCYSPVAERQYL